MGLVGEELIRSDLDELVPLVAKASTAALPDWGGRGFPDALAGYLCNCCAQRRANGVEVVLLLAQRLLLPCLGDWPVGPDKRTALMEAARAGDVELTTRLLSNGAKRTLRDKSGRTAADYAKGNGGVLEMALQDEQSIATYVHRAIRDGDAGAVRGMLRAAPDIPAYAADDGWTALHWASFAGQHCIARDLL